jgi:hypothetical protein
LLVVDKTDVKPIKELPDQNLHRDHVDKIKSWLSLSPNVSGIVSKKSAPLMWVNGVSGCGKTYLVNKAALEAKVKIIPLCIDGEVIDMSVKKRDADKEKQIKNKETKQETRREKTWLSYLMDMSNTKEPSVFLLDHVSLEEIEVRTVLKQFMKLWGVSSKNKSPTGHYIPVILVTEEPYHAATHTQVFTKLNHVKITVKEPSYGPTSLLVQQLELNPSAIELCGSNWHKLKQFLNYGQKDYESSTFLGSNDFERFGKLFSQGVRSKPEEWNYLWKSNHQLWWNMFIHNSLRFSIATFSSFSKQLQQQSTFGLHESIWTSDDDMTHYHFQKDMVKMFRGYNSGVRVEMPPRNYLPTRYANNIDEDWWVMHIYKTNQMNQLKQPKVKRRKLNQPSTKQDINPLEYYVNPVLQYLPEEDNIEQIIKANPCPLVLDSFAQIGKIKFTEI